MMRCPPQFAPPLGSSPYVPQGLSGRPDGAPGDVIPYLGVTFAQLQQVLSLPPDRFIRVNGLQQLAAGAIGTSVAVKFPEDGFVIGISPVPRGDGTAAGFASLALQLLVGQEQGAMTTNGDAADYVLFSSFIGTNPIGFSPMIRRVQQNDTWSVVCRNYSVGTAYTPEVTFAFKRWPR